MNKQDLIDIYNKRLSGEISRFPQIFKNNKEYIRIISKYLFEEILNYSIEDIYENVTEKLLIKYKINNIVHAYFHSIYEYVQYVYPDIKIYPWMFKLGSRNYTEDDNIVKEAIDIFIKKYNLTIDDIYDGAVSLDLVKKDKLFSIFYKRFNGSIFDMFKWYYIQYHNVELDYSKYIHKRNYYNNEKLVELIKNHFLKMGFNELDVSVKNKRLIAEKFNQNELIKICSYTTLIGFGEGSLYGIFKKVYPSYDIYEWEFEITTNNFWSKKNNRINSLKQLINRLNIETRDIPKYINHHYLEQYCSKFNNVCYKYYSSDYYLWVNEVFPNVFTKKEYHYNNIYHDGYKMKSKHEVYLHDILKKVFNNVKYIEVKGINNKFYNEKYDEYYYPDWICDNNIIIEYFGMYYPNNDIKMIKEYTQRADRKIEFYNKLNNYKIIFLFPQDIQQSEEKLIKVLNTYKCGLNEIPNNKI